MCSMFEVETPEKKPLRGVSAACLEESHHMQFRKGAISVIAFMGQRGTLHVFGPVN
jgi:hypothetical protein